MPYAIISEKAMAPHSSTLAWKIPWMEEPGRLQSMGSLRVGHDSETFFSIFTFMHWRRKWQPTAVFLPGESQGRGSLLGFCLWGRTESDTTEATQLSLAYADFKHYYIQCPFVSRRFFGLHYCAFHLFSRPIQDIVVSAIGVTQMFRNGIQREIPPGTIM